MSSSLEIAVAAYPPEPGKRCCPRHPDWPTLAQHLLDDYPDATITDIVREVRRARDAVEGLGIDDEAALGVGEAIARNQLSLLTGRLVDIARIGSSCAQAGEQPR